MLGGLIIRKTGNYIAVIFAGTMLMTLGTGLFISLEKSAVWVKIITFQMIAGVGAGVLFQSPMIALQSHLHQKDLAAAMSAYGFLRSLFTSISIVTGTVLIQRTVGGGNLISVSDKKEPGAATKTEYMSALRIMWIFYTAIAVLMVPASFFIKRKVTKKEDQGEMTRA